MVKVTCANPTPWNVGLNAGTALGANAHDRSDTITATITF
jgi:spore coat protein U-like protein